ncbi:YybH family protein [Edaphobacter aggregans]|uniref:YybH family protein n=1 Tax=Edaphobacter aggregans TaxID=570835 RepID=UPI00068B99FA|nr:SgcJ/EcaC family oxidoreductase [Edaphobacter aggregans]
MKPFAALCAATLVAATLTACKQSSDTHNADVSAVHATEAQWNQDYAARDLDKIMSHYADDAVLMVPGAHLSNGKAAIREGIKPMTADPAMELKFVTTRVEVAKSGDLAYTQGTYTLTLTDPQTKQVIHDRGNYVTTYRKEPDGTWKAVADISTSEVPPPAPAPAPTPKAAK